MRFAIRRCHSDSASSSFLRFSAQTRESREIPAPITAPVTKQSDLKFLLSIFGLLNFLGFCEIALPYIFLYIYIECSKKEKSPFWDSFPCSRQLLLCSCYLCCYFSGLLSEGRSGQHERDDITRRRARCEYQNFLHDFGHENSPLLEVVIILLFLYIY